MNLLGAFMDEQLKNFGKNITEFWKKLSKKAKISIGVLTPAIIIGAVVLTMWMNKTDYVVLFSSLEDTEVAEVMAKLQEKKIEYKYENNGQILVPESSETILRMQLAQEGYPRSGSRS
jgi:flagellar M-ring protein FliF